MALPTASDNVFPKIIESMNTSDPAAPSDSSWKVYAKANGIFARSSNSVVGPFGTGASGAITGTALTMSTARLLGRTTASTGAIEEITVGSGLSLSAGSLTATGGAGGSVVWLQRQTASSSATLDFTGFISSTYDTYVFRIRNIVPATDNVNFLMRAGTGGGPTIDTGANYTNADFRWSNTGSATAGGSADTQWGLDGAGGIDNGSTRGVWGFVNLYDPSSTSPNPHMEGKIGYFDNANSPLGCVFSGGYLSGTAMTAVRFFMSSGNIASGVIDVYGYTHA